MYKLVLIAFVREYEDRAGFRYSSKLENFESENPLYIIDRWKNHKEECKDREHKPEYLFYINGVNTEKFILNGKLEDPSWFIGEGEEVEEMYRFFSNIFNAINF